MKASGGAQERRNVIVMQGKLHFKRMLPKLTIYVYSSWQKLRATELKAQRDSNEEALARLTTRERDIRNRIEDIRHPQSRGTALKFSVKLTNGIEESRKKGKKKTVAALA